MGNINKSRKLLISCSAVALLSSCYGPAFTGNSTLTNTQDNELKEHYLTREDHWLEEVDQIDPKANLSREDYYQTFHGQRNNEDREAEKDVGLPDISDMMVAPDVPVVDNDKLVTISVTEDVPLKEVLVELARRADIDIEIDPTISGGIIFRAKDKPFSEVIERVSHLAGLRYSIENGVLKVSRDTPRALNYRLNMLNQVRKSEAKVDISTSIGGDSSSGGSSGGSSGSSSGGSSGSSSSGGGVGTGSETSLTAKSENTDVWKDIEDGINNILRSTGSQSSSSADSSAAASGGQAAATTTPGVSAILSMNRQAGVISIYATDGQHKLIEEYLDYVQMSLNSQVLIEAKVLEVSLNDDFRSGIDWNLINQNDSASKARIRFDDLGDLGSLSDNVFTVGKLSTDLFGVENTSLQTTINLLESFGTTRTLSSPRLNAMNNQSAILSFAKNHVYITLEVDEKEEDTTSGTSTTTKITSNINTVPVGVILTLQPSIDLDANEVVMNIRPTLSRITDQVADPGFAITAARNGLENTENFIPVVEKRELDSVLRLRSGEIMVIGGLMEERTENNDRGIPGVSKVPVVGNLFKSVQKSSSVVETVVFIKATIVPAKGVSVEDKKFYKKFSRERSQLKFSKNKNEPETEYKIEPEVEPEVEVDTNSLYRQ